MALNRCPAEMLALRRQVSETGRIFLPTASIIVIARPAKKLDKLKVVLTKVKFEGVVRDGNKKPKNFLLKNKEYLINDAEIKKVKFKNVVVLLSLTKKNKFKMKTL